MTPPAVSPLSNLARLGRLIRKELRESLRDRRTVLTLVLMPLLLYPVLAMAFQQLILSSRVDRTGPNYRVAFVSGDEARSLMSYWEEGQQVLVAQQGGMPTKTQPDPPVPVYLDPLPTFTALVTSEPEEAVRQGSADVGVRLSPPGGFDPNPRRLLFVNATVSYRRGSTMGHEAAVYLERLTANRNAAQISLGLKAMGVAQRGDPLRIHAVEEPDESGGKQSFVPVLVPLILILMTMTGAVYPAIDLTAGERERGTLEILVAAPIPRLSVLLAKYVAVVTVALLTALVNLATMTLTLKVTGIGAALFGSTLSVAALLQILALLALFAAFFSAVLLVLTSFARSFKEAQAYLIPLMLFCLMPGVLALMPGLGLNGFLAVVPLVNIVLLSRDVLEGVASPATSGIVVTTTLLYAIGSIALAARIFGTEAVLTSESSGWGDLLRRADSPRASATPAAALLCLALLFPVYFLSNAALAQLDASLPVRLSLASLLNILLFVGAPSLVVFWGRILSRSAFQLRVPSVAAVVIAVLLGLSAWPLIQELVGFLRQSGFTTLREEHLKRLDGAVAQWRSISPLFLVVVLAVIPALAEELFFRGFLLTALLEGGKRPVRAIVGSAALFALFHLLVSDAVAVERLPPSLLLGLILGWLAYRCASIWPGIVLHMLHNALVVLLGYYQPTLVERGWPVGSQGHLPWWLLASSAVGLVVGLLGLAWGRPNNRLTDQSTGGPFQ